MPQSVPHQLHEMINEGQKITGEFATKYRRWILVALLSLFALPLVASCSLKQTDMNLSHDVKALRSFLDLPESISSASWEIATIPESQSSAIPGPTDYVSLIATIHLPEAYREELLRRGRSPSSFDGFPRQFVRPWLTESERGFFIRASEGKTVEGLFDASFLVNNNRAFKYAVGLIIGSVAIIYVNYVSP